MMSVQTRAGFRRTVQLAVCLALAFGGNAVANDIYKWTDAEGNVHYEDRPTEDGTAERLDIKSKPTDTSRIAAMQQARQEARSKAAAAEAEAAEQGPTPEELRAEKKEREKECVELKERLQGMVQSRRLYREDENGERVYLSDDEMQAAREDAADKVAEYCGS